MMKYDQSPLSTKSYRFGVRVVRLCRELDQEGDSMIASQLIRSATSIGANIREARFASSRREFSYKLGISLQESSESEYWLQILQEAGEVSRNYDEYLQDVHELIKMLHSSVKTSRSES